MTLYIPAHQVCPVRSVAGQGLQSDSSIQGEEVIHCAGVSSCLWTIGEVTTNHPGDGEDDNNVDDDKDDMLTYLYPPA